MIFTPCLKHNIFLAGHYKRRKNKETYIRLFLENKYKEFSLELPRNESQFLMEIMYTLDNLLLSVKDRDIKGVTYENSSLIERLLFIYKDKNDYKRILRNPYVSKKIIDYVCDLVDNFC